MNIHKHTIVCLAFFSFSAQAKCVLPVPDGEEGQTSNRNLAGYLIEKNNQEIKIEKYPDRKIVSVKLGELKEAYSAFGGDEEISKLNTGIAVRIWYKSCKNSEKPQAAYIEFFSNSSLDQPEKSYFTTKGR
ncbi:hypothetical protein [Acidovorax sp. Leaf78]|uniref:hypothetical protein n=1 Tax=unclassified Acidovorax TaxID=2684926 RepID=UPI0012E0CD40|nr:hypothetical protein [Acidovorax sp. Leaf78]